MILYITVAAVTVLLAGMVVNRPVTQPYRVTRQQMYNRVSLLSVFLILFALSPQTTAVASNKEIPALEKMRMS